MSLWLCRAGRQGEYESKFLTDKRIYLTWDQLDIDLNDVDSQDNLYEILIEKYDLDKKTQLSTGHPRYGPGHLR